MNATRPWHWSVRREIWENRSIYIAPLAVALFVLFGFLFSMFHLPQRMRGLAGADPARQREVVTMPLNAIAGMLVMIAFVVGFFYCLDALHGERRDRSILFWKSLPVSDRTAVLSKASIPLVVLPFLVFVIALPAQVFMILFSTLRLLGHKQGLAMYWTHVTFVQSAFALLYALIAIALWHAPIYAWALLISAWCRRAAVLWAILPPLAIAAIERMMFGTTLFIHFLGYRLAGWFQQAFFIPPKGTKVALAPLESLTPLKFLATPGLWLGLLVAAAFLAAAVRLRRNREPI